MSSTDTMSKVQEWVNAVTDLLTIIENDPETAAPRPLNLPAIDTYASIGWTTDSSPMSTPYEAMTDEEGDENEFKQYRSLLRSRQLGIEVFGPGAADYVAALELSLGGPAYMTLLGAEDIAIHKTGVMSDEPTILSTERLPDASTTFTVGWTDSEIESLAAVEAVVPEIDGVTP